MGVAAIIDDKVQRIGEANMSDAFDSKIPSARLGHLLELGTEIGFYPASSLEAEAFFASLLMQFTGPEAGLKEWLREQIAAGFRCVGQKPIWIQNPSWPFTEHGPMVFVGQINIPRGLFHDEASFYTFYDQQTGVVMLN